MVSPERIRGGIDSHFDGRYLPVASAIYLTTETLCKRLILGMSVKLSDRDGHVKQSCIQFSVSADITECLPQSYWGFASNRFHANKAPAASKVATVSAIPHTSFGDSNRNSTSCVPAGISTARSKPNAVAISTGFPSI